MENYYEVSNGEYLITTNPSLLSVDIIHCFKYITPGMVNIKVALCIRIQTGCGCF